MNPATAFIDARDASAARASTCAWRWALALMVASGFAGLGYQIVWTQQSALWLGHETAAVLAVVAAFFGGMGAGALLVGARIDASTRPARWYAACEAIIGLWCLCLAFVMPPVSRVLLDLTGAQAAPLWQWTVVFCGTFLVLLPATAAMGATLPAMERILATLRAQGAPIATLYAGNTFGAVLGALAAAFVLIPRFGLSSTTLVCVLLNLVCAAAALRAFAPRSAVVPMATSVNGRHHLAVLAATGLLGIGYEVLVVRVLSQVAENTVYTFAILLAVYLIGTALGAAGYGRWAKRTRASGPVRDRLLQLLAFTCCLGAGTLAGAGAIKAALLPALGASMTAALAIEALLAVAAFLLPTIMMGALFSHLATSARAAGVGFGRALGMNTLGAAFAPLLCGLLLLPVMGLTFALLTIAGGYLLLVSRSSWFSWPQLSTVATALALATWAPSLANINLSPGGRLVSFAEGTNATVSVVEDANGVATLHINNRQQEGSSATLLADARQGVLPILLHPAPRRALFLGLGTGVTSHAASADTTLRVNAVELLPEVVSASAHFTAAFGEERDPRLRILVADARRYVRAARDRYDVIVADNFHPARSGSGALYTTEHFAAVRERLSPDGVFCQWLPLHQLDLGTLRSIVRSFVTVYPRAWAMLATNSLDTPVVGLVARRDGGRFVLKDLRARLAGVRMPRSPSEFGIGDDLALLGGFIAGPDSLATFSSKSPLNTDDHPVVTYSAPRITYAPDSAPRDRLLELLRIVEIRPEELLTRAGDSNWNRRLAAYWTARDRYLEIGHGVRALPDVQAMLAQVREPLLSVLHISPDFRPAYDPLLRMATTLAVSDAPAARVLLMQLAQAQPERPEAAAALRELP